MKVSQYFGEHVTEQLCHKPTILTKKKPTCIVFMTSVTGLQNHQVLQNKLYCPKLSGHLNSYLFIALTSYKSILLQLKFLKFARRVANIVNPDLMSHFTCLFYVYTSCECGKLTIIKGPDDLGWPGLTIRIFPRDISIIRIRRHWHHFFYGPGPRCSKRR